MHLWALVVWKASAKLPRLESQSADKYNAQNEVWDKLMTCHDIIKVASTEQ